MDYVYEDDDVLSSDGEYQDPDNPYDRERMVRMIGTRQAYLYGVKHAPRGPKYKITPKSGTPGVRVSRNHGPKNIEESAIMEWWETEDYTPVDERLDRIAGGLSYTNNGGKTNRALWYNNGYVNYQKTNYSKDQFGNTIGTQSRKGVHAGVVGAGAAVAAYGAKKLYDRFKKPKTDPKKIPVHVKGYNTNAPGGRYAEGEVNGYLKAKESWMLDPGADMIMDSYFSEFSDADTI